MACRIFECFMNTERNTLLFFALVAGMFCAISASALDAVTLPQAIVGNRGSVEVVTVTGTLDASGNTKIVLEYPADVIKIRKVIGGEGFALLCPSVLIATDSMVTSTTGRVTLECWNVQPTNDKELFAMEIEFLAGPGTSGVLRAVGLERNGTNVADVQLSQASVTANGAVAKSESLEGVTGNYPNPFSSSTDFVFRLAEPSVVHLSIHSLDGRRLLDLQTMQASAGENVYHFAPNAWDVSSGPYIFSVETETFTYLHQFMVLK